MSRITHRHDDVNAQIQNIIVKVAVAYPQQSMWSLMAVQKSTSNDRAKRGKQALTKLKVA
jgi:serine/threonine-protein kinase ATR